MANHIYWRHVSCQDHNAFDSFFDGLDYIFDSSPEGLFSVEVASEFENFVAKRVVGLRVGDRRVVEGLGVL